MKSRRRLLMEFQEAANRRSSFQLAGFDDRHNTFAAAQSVFTGFTGQNPPAYRRSTRGTGIPRHFVSAVGVATGFPPAISCHLPRAGKLSHCVTMRMSRGALVLSGFTRNRDKTRVKYIRHKFPTDRGFA